MDLEQALTQFDRTEANLARLQSVWNRMQELIPSGISFPGDAPEELLYEDLSRAFADIASGLPAINGAQLDALPLTLREIAQQRFDAAEISEPEILIGLGEEMAAPARAVAEYRHRFIRARKALVRDRVIQLIADVDGALTELAPRYQRDGQSVAEDADWQTVRGGIKETERLLAQDLVRTGEWGTLNRHLGFAQGTDLHDIVERDWPAAKADIENALYGELEPLPIEADDLGLLAKTQPEGAVTTALNWEGLSDDDFERLIYNLFTNAAGYENPKWLMKTRAPDRGRDLSVDRVVSDALSEVKRSRVIVQCRHWRSRSMSASDCISAVGLISLWEPPPVDVLIIATSGRFTADGVQWVENHNLERSRPHVELWAESHLESLLAARPALVTELGLRGS
jgi:hypothetical protein